MRYAKIREMDTTNGDGICVSIFVQGCHFHCKDCWNESTWDFCGGNEFNNEVKQKLLDLCDKPYIKGLSILGGEPLADENVEEIALLIHDFKCRFPNKMVYLWSGYTYETIVKDKFYAICNVDVLIDGLYDYKQRDLSLKLRGSSNQRIIDVQQSLLKDEIILKK